MDGITGGTVKAFGLAALAMVFSVGITMAQTQLPFAYPKAGQSQQQAAQDSHACQGWAQQQTNFNPQQAELNMLRQQQAQQQQLSQAQQQQQSAAGRQGGLLRGAAGGAALGAVGGFVKLTDCRLISAYLHEAKPLKLHRTANGDLPRFRIESG